MMDKQYIFWVLTIIGVSLEILGDIYLKRWAVESRNTFLIVGFAIYIIGAMFWAYSLKFETLSRAISIFTILNLIIVALVGIIFFKEDLSIMNRLGIFLGIISIICLEY